MRTGSFLPSCGPGSVPGSIKVWLSGRAADLKRQMLACFTTQRATLAPFQTSYELFRLAPRYDFSRPPHDGTLYYETFDWGVTGEQWRDRARDAALSLGIQLPW
jgi:hypothetical protein